MKLCQYFNFEIQINTNIFKIYLCNSLFTWNFLHFFCFKLTLQDIIPELTERINKKTEWKNELIRIIARDTSLDDQQKNTMIVNSQEKNDSFVNEAV